VRCGLAGGRGPIGGIVPPPLSLFGVLFVLLDCW